MLIRKTFVALMGALTASIASTYAKSEEPSFPNANSCTTPFELQSEGPIHQFEGGVSVALRAYCGECGIKTFNTSSTDIIMQCQGGDESNVVGLVIPVSFLDANLEKSFRENTVKGRENFTKLKRALNETGYIDNALKNDPNNTNDIKLKGSVKDYFEEVSEGQLSLTHIVADSIVLYKYSFDPIFARFLEKSRDCSSGICEIEMKLDEERYGSLAKYVLKEYEERGGTYDGLSLQQDPKRNRVLVKSLVFVTSENTGGKVYDGTEWKIYDGVDFGNVKTQFAKSPVLGLFRGYEIGHVAAQTFIVTNPAGTEVDGHDEDIYRPGVSALAHELGHNLFGWPDLYDLHCFEEDSDNDCIDEFDGIRHHSLMANGKEIDGYNPLAPNPYFRSKEWGTLTEIPFGTTSGFDVNYNSNVNYKIVNPNNPKEFLIISANDNTVDGFYGGQPSSGLMIWHVGVNNWGSGKTIPYEAWAKDEHYYVEQADGRYDLDRHKKGDPSPSKGDECDAFKLNDSFPVLYKKDEDCLDTSIAVPRSTWWDGSDYNFEVSFVDTTADGISFQVNFFDSFGTVDVQVDDKYDDVEFYNGSVERTSNDLDFKKTNVIGIRFNNVSIPDGARIKHAYIQFTADENHSEYSLSTIKGEKAGFSTLFQSGESISDRAQTLSTVEWAPEEWEKGDSRLVQRTPNLSKIVEEVVSLPDWSEGNSMVFYVTRRSGSRAAVSYDKDSDKAPMLHIEYE